MTSSSILQGLTVVHPAPPSPQSNDLVYPELPNHLDLWTNLAFASDEPLLDSHLTKKNSTVRRDGDPDDDTEDIDSDESFLQDRGAARHDSHINVVTGTDVLPPNLNPPLTPPPQFDINAFLAGFAIDPFALPVSAPQQQHQQQQSPSPPAQSPTNLSPAEDKRRRNTAASARFRMKKKEREAALESRAKELESKVNELEKECEGLRRENGWLKGLVVGVTGAAAQPQPQAQVTVAQVAVGSKRGREDEASTDSEPKPSKIPLIT